MGLGNGWRPSPAPDFQIRHRVFSVGQAVFQAGHRVFGTGRRFSASQPVSLDSVSAFCTWGRVFFTSGSVSHDPGSLSFIFGRLSARSGTLSHDPGRVFSDRAAIPAPRAANYLIFTTHLPVPSGHFPSPAAQLPSPAEEFSLPAAVPPIPAGCPAAPAGPLPIPAAPTGLGNGVAQVATKISLRTERRTGVPNQPQRGCSLQPSVGVKRLRWVNGQMENNSEGVASGGGGFNSTPSELMNLGNGFPG